MVLPPLSSLPIPIYPPSMYPPPSYFEQPQEGSQAAQHEDNNNSRSNGNGNGSSIISNHWYYPAIIIPARRTNEIQKFLKDRGGGIDGGVGLLYQKAKRKSVYCLEEGIDYVSDDLGVEGYDPKKERKLVLNRFGPASNNHCDDDNIVGNLAGTNDDILELMKKDKVFQEPRVQSLLSPSSSSSLSTNGSKSSGNQKRKRGQKGQGSNDRTAPRGRCNIRPSYIRLPDTLYSLLTVDQILRRLLPSSLSMANHSDAHDNAASSPSSSLPPSTMPLEEVPSSFEIIGHIAHLNLRSEALPYKYLIGKAILDKNRPRIRLVVNKIGNIENEFRTFPMEILAADPRDNHQNHKNGNGNNDCGDVFDLQEVERLCAGTAVGSSNLTPSDVQIRVGKQHDSWMQVQVKEHGCRFQLDFAKVYWNSRLQSEHDRLVRFIVGNNNEKQHQPEAVMTSHRNDITNNEENDNTIVVADAMAGVGPFAVPLTSSNFTHSQRITCHANDLNPISYHYLVRNSKLNRCYSDRLILYNLDAREFIHNMNDCLPTTTSSSSSSKKKVKRVDHFIMNLPQSAPEFLDAFRGWKFLASNDDDNSPGCDDISTKVIRPMIHVHCFGPKPSRSAISTTDDKNKTSSTESTIPPNGKSVTSTENSSLQPEDEYYEKEIKERFETALGCTLDKTLDQVSIHIVRDVGPRKNMLCVSFRLPWGVSKLNPVNLGIYKNDGHGNDVDQNKNGKRDRAKKMNGDEEEDVVDKKKREL